jgi:hypothetical protein
MSHSIRQFVSAWSAPLMMLPIVGYFLSLLKAVRCNVSADAGV